MSSRINKSPKHIFDCFLEVVRPQAGQDDVSKPWILQSYPPAYKDSGDERLRSVPQFTFPCYVSVSQIQHFSFVLTSLEAQWTYGFCRYSPNSDTAFCILSYLPWHELFFKMLNQCAEIIQNSGNLDLFLSSVYNSRLPVPGLAFNVTWGDKVFTGNTPNTLYLASIPESRNLTEYYNAVEPNLMIAVFASMLHERRIVVTASRLGALSACVQAANTLIYPMFWQHIFIPVLPAHLMDYLSAPMPFLIGVPQPLFARTKANELGDVVILDIDNKTFESPFNDVDNLPSEIVYNLRKSLSPNRDHLGDAVARAFLQALVHLIGGYREALKYRQGEKVSFSDDDFIKSRSSSVQPFLIEMLQLQIFRQFIDERLELLNAGKGFSDQFELECVSFSEEKYSRKPKHVAAINNVKREGAALAKAVKEKANPAMKQAVKTVKDGGKMARTKVKASYKDAKLKFKDDREEIPDESGNTHSAPSSPTMRRVSNISSPNTSFLTRNNTDLNFGRVLKYEKFDPPDRRDLSPEYGEIEKLDYDFMKDIEEVMNRNKVENYTRLAGNTSSSSTPVKRLSSNTNHITIDEKSNPVGDLITLSDADTVVFDPLLDNQRYSHNPHKKLERAGTASSVNGEVRKHSQGKYENHVPAGGASHREFKDFMSTMTEPSNGHSSRSSEDVKLNEFGINFNAMSVTRQAGPDTSPLMGGQGQPPPVPPRSSNNSFLHNCSPHIPGYSNNTLPVNSRLSSVGRQANAVNSRDSLADLDPFGPSNFPNSQPAPANNLPSGQELVSSPLPPPVVPPRSKKQWTTFD